MLPSVFLDYLMLSLGILTVTIFSILSYMLFVLPARKIINAKTAPPVEGYEHTIIFNKHQSLLKINIGLLHNDINLRLKGIKESHLSLKLRKDPDIEDYDIMFKAKGIVFMQRPHTRTKERLTEQIRFSSSELIGHPATISLVATLTEGKPSQYVEFKFATDYYYDNENEEKMKFVLHLNTIYPKIDWDSRNKVGIYNFETGIL